MRKFKGSARNYDMTYKRWIMPPPEEIMEEEDNSVKELLSGFDNEKRKYRQLSHRLEGLVGQFNEATDFIQSLKEHRETFDKAEHPNPRISINTGTWLHLNLEDEDVGEFHEFAMRMALKWLRKVKAELDQMMGEDG
jgi:hypothetical protein